MSGIIGHTMYAILAGKAATQKKLPIVPVIYRNYASYLAGSYLGCDIQIMPEAVCIDTGQEVGFGTAPLNQSPLTGGEVKPWSLKFEAREYRPRAIHRLFYGRVHLVFGWTPAERKNTVPWDHLPDYAAMVFQDAKDLYGPGERKLAYLFGWLAHIVGDSLIKSVRSGITLDMLGGKYTPANRPIQDLVTFHEVGRKELRLDWSNLLTDLAETPIEPVQLHYMRVGQPRGMLAADFPDAWAPQYEPLLLRVLEENRRYQKIRNLRLIKKYALVQSGTSWKCDEELSRKTGGLTYKEMVEAAERAQFRHALWEMGEAIVVLFEQVIERVPYLQTLPNATKPTWDEITARWKKSKSSK
ncbi:hypothetical protein [Gimesia aquarii]|uniref:Phospholipase C/D domain-containing protein n=1 Tax=Gimesia aquarii TaxID=2527964 RepID=A0A517WUI9_9PLAN|nr:hypothetical protein [Gimesia aquarii]QDU08916.1 hypothetical protein V202x_22860 [Gimesia aquarii]